MTSQLMEFVVTVIPLPEDSGVPSSDQLKSEGSGRGRAVKGSTISAVPPSIKVYSGSNSYSGGSECVVLI